MNYYIQKSRYGDSKTACRALQAHAVSFTPFTTTPACLPINTAIIISITISPATCPGTPSLLPTAARVHISSRAVANGCRRCRTGTGRFPAAPGLLDCPRHPRQGVVP